MTDYIKKEFTKYFNATDVFATLFDKCTRYMFPTVMQPIDEFIRLNDAINNMRQIECKDVEPVVRCRDCKWKADTIGDSWCDFHEFTILSDDDFCSYGERKDNDKSCDTCKRYDKWWDDIVCDGCTKAYSNWERKDNE